MGVFSIGKVLIDSLFKKPATLMYPVVPREWEERTRGAVGIDIEGCVLCGMCQRACPTNAITVDRKAATWSIERMNCVQCRGCVDNCPPNCLIMEQKYTEPGVEKVIDTFDIPKKEKPKKADAGKADAAGADTKAPAATPAASDGDDALTCDLETCVYCGICAKECPVDALKVERKPDKIWEVDQDECISCGACIDKCPKGSLSFGGAASEAPTEKLEAKDEAPTEKIEAKEEAPAEKAEAKEAKSEAKAEAKKPLREALEMDDETKEKVEGYIAQVKDALVSEFKMAEDAAHKLIEDENLKGQLARFPYLLRKEARETAERIKK
jgi:formate hydrogenlyase subunit 6/NADH:ubiquinone oxidoreductase subunit I